MAMEIHHLFRFKLLLGVLLLFPFGLQSDPTNSPTHPNPRPDSKARQQQAAEDFVKKTAADSDAEYTQMFTELGLKPQDSERFKGQLANLHRKAIVAGDAMGELIQARVDYDKDIHQALGDENYQRYRFYEESKPAKCEYALLTEFASKSNNFAMDSLYSERIVRLFKDTGATTTEGWAGPYDPRPHPEIGLIMVRTVLSKQANEYRQASSNLVQALPKSGLPERYQQLLKDYCSFKTSQMDAEIARFSVSEEEFKRQMMKEAQKDHDELMMKIHRNSATPLF